MTAFDQAWELLKRINSERSMPPVTLKLPEGGFRLRE